MIGKGRKPASARWNTSVNGANFVNVTIAFTRSQEAAMAKSKGRRVTMAEARRRCRLSDEQVRRARKMGFFPYSLTARIPTPAQQRKQPVGDWIDSMYEKYQKEDARKRAMRTTTSEQALPPSYCG